MVFDNHSAQKSSDLPLFTNGMPALLYKKAGNHITLFGHSVPNEEWIITKKDRYVFQKRSLCFFYRVIMEKISAEKNTSTKLQHPFSLGTGKVVLSGQIISSLNSCFN
jgi:hypothetical protein